VLLMCSATTRPRRLLLLLQRHTSSVGKLVRSANSGLRATIFGAYGFVGRYVTALVGEW
jgi:hypothetical protein